LRTVSGTAGFLAPELLGFIDLDSKSNFSYTTAVDIWAVGEINFRMLSGGEAVFRNLNQLRKYVEGRLDFPSEDLFTHGVSQEAYSFTKNLMTAIPDNRPRAEKALEFDWLKSQRDFSEYSFENENLHHTDTRTDSKAGTAKTPPETEIDEPPSLPVSSLNSTLPFIQFDFYPQRPSSDDEIERLFKELVHKRGWQDCPESIR
jgi:serine/threonine protein kinase